jgi:hypothetical protein
MPRDQAAERRRIGPESPADQHPREDLVARNELALPPPLRMEKSALWNPVAALSKMLNMFLE